MPRLPTHVRCRFSGQKGQRSNWPRARGLKYLRRLEHTLDAAMGLALTRRDRRRLRKPCVRVRGPLFTFLDHSEVADDDSSERELRPPQPIAKSPAASARPVRRRPLPHRNSQTPRR